VNYFLLYLKFDYEIVILATVIISFEICSDLQIIRITQVMIIVKKKLKKNCVDNNKKNSLASTSY
jgi:NADH:ubiquinone oxidoreductase subunit 3 (subunit A)